MKLTKEIFEQQRSPRFGNENPERIHNEFWEWMIRGEGIGLAGEVEGAEESGSIVRDGKLKSSYGPYRARDLFNVPLNPEDGPIWTFERYGASRTESSDGRVICVGGEHEDYYDPDFYIYNDLVVFGPDEKIEIYGYPREIFPPTDFHTATLLGDEIIVVGCLGNASERRPGFTPVYSVNTNSYRISEIVIFGNAPGWIFEHAAEVSDDGIITIHGGQVFEEQDGKQQFRRNNDMFALDLTKRAWAKTTNRNWQQWSICREDGGLFVLENDVRLRDLVPQEVEPIPLADENGREARFLLRGVPIRVIAGVKRIEVVAEGDLPENLRGEVKEVFRNRVEILCKKKCVVL